LGLILYFQYFGELGGLGIITAWWGVWHMVSGLSLSFYWKNKDKKAAAQL
jgi:BASS family bile acid:Na+ symporter